MNKAQRLLPVLFLLLTACAPIPSPTPTPTLSPSPTATPHPTTPPPEREMELHLWISDTLLDPQMGDEAPLQLQIADFAEQHSGIDIEVLVKKNDGPGGILDLLSTASQAAPTLLPDLVLMDRRTMLEAATASLVRPMPPAMIPGSTSEAALAASQVGTATLGLPYLVDLEGITMRPTSLLTAPDGHLLWEEVISHNLTLLFPAAPPDDAADDFILRLYLETGGHLQDEDGGPALDREALESTYGFIAEALQAGVIMPEIVLTLADAQACWTTFRTSERWQITVLPAADYWLTTPRQDRPLEALLPKPEATPQPIGHYWMWTVLTDNPQRQEALAALLNWLFYPPNLSDVSQAVRLFPTTGEALALWSLPPDDFTAVGRLVAHPIAPPPPTVDGNVRKALQSGLRLLLENPGEVSPGDAAEHALLTLRK